MSLSLGPLAPGLADPRRIALLAALGAAAWLGVAEATGGGAPVPWSFVAGSLAAEMLMPMLGLGFALGLSGPRGALAGLALFGTGVAIGLAERHAFLTLVARLPNAATHQFLTGPIAGLAVGLLLLAPRIVRPILLPPVALLCGAMLAVAVKLLDPSLRDPHVPWLAGAAALAVLLAVAALVARIRHPFVAIAARILGSWVLAVAFLYGGATLATKGRAVVPPVAPRMAPAGEMLFPDFEPPPSRRPDFGNDAAH